MFFVLASLGLPGLGNFVAEFLVLLGLFQVNPWLTVLASMGLITGAIYSLMLMQRSFQGETNPQLDSKTVADFGSRELLTMAIMVIALVVLGIYPQPVLDIAQMTIAGTLEHSLSGAMP